jgi:hypothetical protein
VPASPDQALGIRLHQQLQHRLRHAAQEVAFTGLLQQLGQWQSLLGHRSSVQVKPRNSTLAGRPDGHLTAPANFHHQRGRYLLDQGLACRYAPGGSTRSSSVSLEEDTDDQAPFLFKDVWPDRRAVPDRRAAALAFAAVAA